MPAMKLIGGELLDLGGRLSRTVSVAALWAILASGLPANLPVAAQEPDAAAQPDDAVTAEVLARISEMVQAGEIGQPEDMAAPDDLAATNSLPQAASPTQTASRSGRSDRSDHTNRFQTSGRSQPEDRRSRGRRSYRSKSDQPRTPGSSGDYSRTGDRTQANTFPDTNNGPARVDYSAFKVIVDRNIFDPNRYAHRPGEPGVRPAPRTVDSLTLVGTMSYERGTFAFFDGSSSEYKKALKLSDVIAGYKLTNIAASGVKLAAGTNKLELRVGMQLRREEGGAWRLASHSGAYAPLPASYSTNNAAASTAAGTNATSGSAEAESDIIKKLMQRREQE